jgi:hypothetical protein
MPTKFNTANEGQRTDLDPVIPIQMPMYDSSGSQQMMASTGAAAVSVLDSISSGNDDRALGAYSVEAAEIIGQTEGYRAERERILQGLSTAQDKATMERYLKDLSRLRNGEIQGALRPGAASARINQLTKDYINRNPNMAKEFRQIHNGLMDDVTAVAGSTGREVDPDLEALNEITKSAILNNRTTAQEMDYRRQKSIGEAQVETLAAKSRLGTASEADIANAVLSNGAAYYADIVSKMTSAAKDPNFQGMNWYAELTAASIEIEQQTNLMLQQIQLESPMHLSREFQTDLVTKALAPMKGLLAIAEKVDNPKTRLAASNTLRQMTENKNYMYLDKLLGPAVTLYSGTENLGTYLNELHDVSQRLAKQGKAELEAIAKYDPKTRMMLDTIYARGWEQFAADSAAAVDKKEPSFSSGNPTMDKLSLQAQIEYVMRPANKDAAGGLEYIAGNPNAFEAWDKRMDVVNKTKTLRPDELESVLGALKQTSARTLTESASQADITSMRSIRFNALDTKSPFAVGTVASAPNVNYGTAQVPGGLLGDKLVYTDYHTAQLVNRLNQQYRVFANFMPRAQAQKWAAESLDNLTLVSTGEMDTKVQAVDAVTEPPVDQADPLAAEAAQAGMTVEEFKKWANTPAQ